MTQLLNSEGSWIYNSLNIALEINNHLISIHAQIQPILPPDPTYLNMIPKLTVDDCRLLTALPEAKEIKAALWSIHPFKAPGKDGLHAIFYQKNWKDIKDKIIREVTNIFNVWQFQESWCKTLLCLIPKLANPSSANHFRPLGLYTTHYKIVVKMLVNRLRPHL